MAGVKKVNVGPSTVGSRFPIRHTPKAWSMVPIPETKIIHCTTMAVCRASIPTPPAMIRGTASDPAMNSRTCCILRGIRCAAPGISFNSYPVNSFWFFILIFLSFLWKIG